jgi:hypothetical protein
MRNKSEAFQALKTFIETAENQLDKRVKEVRSDGGGEFGSNIAKQYYSDKGIVHHIIPPDAHAQNGRVERPHRTILDSVRTLLSDTLAKTILGRGSALHGLHSQSTTSL